MKTITVRCDRCSNEVTRDPGRVVLSLEAGPTPPTSGDSRIDLCGPCRSSLLRWLAEHAAELALSADPIHTADTLN